MQSKSYISQFTSLLRPVRGRGERSNMNDKIVEDIEQIDMSKLTLPSFAIYKNPTDYPGKSVARLFEGDKPTDVVLIKKNVRELHSLFRNRTRLTFFPPLPGDPGNLVGVWM